MDLVTQNLVAAFKAEESLPEKMDDATVLEHFVNYCAISNEYGEEFDVEDLHTGGPDDLGIDGVAVIVNGTLVLDEQEVLDLVSANRYIEANLIFCQSKSGGFSGDEISNTFFGLKDLLSTKSSMPRNTRIAEKERLIKFIYGQRTTPSDLPLSGTATYQDQDGIVRLDAERREVLARAAVADGEAPPGQRALERRKNAVTHRFRRVVIEGCKALTGLPIQLLELVPLALQRIKEAAEKAKKELSSLLFTPLAKACFFDT